MEDLFTSYKRAIKAKYEVEKTGDNADYLLNPTLAKLRRLCIHLLNNNLNNNEDDKIIFRNFFGFEIGADSIKKIKDEENKFRRFEKFLKNESDLATDLYAADFLALLLNYELRPYKKYRESQTLSKANNNAVAIDNTNTTQEEMQFITFLKEDNIYSINKEKASEENHFKSTVAKTENIDKEEEEEEEEKFNILYPEDINSGEKPEKRSRKKTLIIAMLSITFLSGGYITKKTYFSEKQCMQWQGDHYEIMDCDEKNIGNSNSVTPLDKKIVELKKVKLEKGMDFFNHGKPLYYYYKITQDSTEFFNAPGQHPITGLKLRPITWYMIDKYVK